MSTYTDGSLRIIGATPGGAWKVLLNLSRHEQAERDRLGITSPKGILGEVSEERAWLLIAAKSPYTVKALFGVTANNSIWFLPTEDFSHNRQFFDPKVIKWVLDFVFDSIPTGPDKKPPVLFNGVTPENTATIKWLKKAVGAAVAATPVPSDHNGHPVLPFFIHHEPDYV